MIGYYNYTVILTYLSLTAAIFGMTFVVEGKPMWAVVCLMLSGLCDMFDGVVARTRQRTAREKKFGIELDSLADLVAFGVLPAMIGYAMGMNQIYHKIILALYVIAALIRLAYFTVTEEEREQTAGGPRRYYDGMPVTAMALLFPATYCICEVLRQQSAGVYTVLLFCAALAFVARIQVRKPSFRQLCALAAVGTAVLIALLALQAR